MTLETEDTSPRCQLTAVFRAARDFRFEAAGGETRIFGLDVIDISARQWEGIKWEIIDDEDDDIKFVCREIQLTNIKAL